MSTQSDTLPHSLVLSVVVGQQGDDDGQNWGKKVQPTTNSALVSHTRDKHKRSQSTHAHLSTKHHTYTHTRDELTNYTTKIFLLFVFFFAPSREDAAGALNTTTKRQVGLKNYYSYAQALAVFL